MASAIKKWAGAKTTDFFRMQNEEVRSAAIDPVKKAKAEEADNYASGLLDAAAIANTKLKNSEASPYGKKLPLKPVILAFEQAGEALEVAADAKEEVGEETRARGLRLIAHAARVSAQKLQEQARVSGRS